MFRNTCTFVLLLVFMCCVTAFSTCIIYMYYLLVIICPGMTMWEPAHIVAFVETISHGYDGG